MLLSIIVCTGGTIGSDTVSCLVDTLVKTPYPKFIWIASGGYKQNSLTLGINVAKDHQATHVMFIDNDMIFPPEGIKQLIEQDLDVVGAPYNEKRLPLQSTVKISDERGNLIASDISKYTEPFKVYALGFGFMLCKISVFDRITRPYFNALVDEDDVFTTDDVYFCDKLQKAGVEIWCDPRVVVKHQGSYLY